MGRLLKKKKKKDIPKIHIPVDKVKQELKDIKVRQKERKTLVDTLKKNPNLFTNDELVRKLFVGLSDMQENLARLENRLIKIEDKLEKRS